MLKQMSWPLTCGTGTHGVAAAVHGAGAAVVAGTGGAAVDWQVAELSQET